MKPFTLKNGILFVGFFLLFAILNFGLTQINDSGSVDTTGITVTIQPGGTIDQVGVTSFILICDSASANSLLVCVNADDISGTCDFELQPGEQLNITGTDASGLRKIHFEADVNPALFRWLAFL